jgi:hypothetical protein
VSECRHAHWSNRLSSSWLPTDAANAPRFCQALRYKVKAILSGTTRVGKFSGPVSGGAIEHGLRRGVNALVNSADHH